MKLVVVLGAGTMGSAIAAQIASAGVEVLLLDMPSPAGLNRNQVALSGIEKVKKLFTHNEDEKFIKVGNFEDDLEKMRGADWIIEVIVENLEAKAALFSKIAPYVSDKAVVSSNTSTIPLAEIIAVVPANIAGKMIITHFFNPPRFLSLLEVVCTKKTDEFTHVLDFCTNDLGKKLVFCADTPGFIANRVGFFWMYAAMVISIECKLKIEVVDALLSMKFMGIPSTGVFGLVDLIGLDVFMFIMNSLVKRLPSDDELCKLFQTKIPVIDLMIRDGRIGRKAGSGFYRKYDSGNGPVMQALDLKSGTYYNVKVDEEISKMSEHGLFDHSKPHGNFMTFLFARTLAYVSALVPDVASDIYSVDVVMRSGYNWKYGLFEVIDELSQSLYKDFFVLKLQSMGIQLPPLLQQSKPFYSEKTFLDVDGSYKKPHKDFMILSDIIRSKKPVITNLSASLWDIGDGIVCFDIKSKARTLDIHVFRLLYDAINVVGQYFRGMIIGSDDKHFSSGANLSYFMLHMKDQLLIMNLLSYGQDIMTALKGAKFPVVAAVSGNALGGGCELLMHCHHVVAHIESYVGFAEAKLGLIPSWGGCKEMVLRCLRYEIPLQEAYDSVLRAYITGSARYIREFSGINPDIIMNRDRLISYSKEKVISLITSPSPDEKVTPQKLLSQNKIVMPDKSKLSDHDMKVAMYLKDIFEVDGVPSESSLLEKERAAFVALLQTEEAKSRIAKVLKK